MRTWLIVSPDAVTVWPNMTWPMSIETLGLALTSSAMAAGAAGEAGLALLAVAVELQVGEVDPAAFHALDGGQRGGVAAGDAQIAAMDVDRVRHAERASRASASVVRMVRGVMP